MSKKQTIHKPTSAAAGCPSCEGDVRTEVETETFGYVSGGEEAELTVRVPVRICDHCDFRFTDHEAEEIRHDAVCRYLRVMTPREISALRRRYGLSRAEFARLTALGEASLARWERGELIQSPAHDHYLRLLQSPQNLEILKTLRLETTPPTPAARHPTIASS